MRERKCKERREAREKDKIKDKSNKGISMKKDNKKKQNENEINT